MVWAFLIVVSVLGLALIKVRRKRKMREAGHMQFKKAA
jgi:hypothetical protein